MSWNRDPWYVRYENWIIGAWLAAIVIGSIIVNVLS